MVIINYVEDDELEVVDFHAPDENGRRRTWTGKLVSGTAWRELSEWDKFGPNGRHFCGLCQAWVQPWPDESFLPRHSTQPNQGEPR